MAEKILNTRIQLKYDSLENWARANTLLKQGEVAVAYLPPKGDGVAPAAVSEAVLMKVGPGNFNDLPFVSALAADIYSWAKQSENDFVNTFLALKMTDGTTMQSKLDAIFATDTALTDAISGLKTEITTTTLAAYYTKTEVDSLITELREDINLPDGGFASKTEFDALKNKVEDEDGALAKANEAYALAETKSAVTASSTNGKLGLNGSDITVYDDTALAGRVEVLEGKTDLGQFTNNAGYAKTADVKAELAKKADKSVVEAMYTNTQIDDLLAGNAAAVLGDSNDLASANTVYGAKAAAAAAQSDATIAKTKIETFLGTVTPDGSDAIIDTLAEINKYVGDHGQEFATLSGEVDKIKNGTTVVPKAADADTLDGHDSSYFATSAENGAKALAEAALPKATAEADYVKKADATGYDDILTKTAAQDIYATKAEATYTGSDNITVDPDRKISLKSALEGITSIRGTSLDIGTRDSEGITLLDGGFHTMNGRTLDLEYDQISLTVGIDFTINNVTLEDTIKSTLVNQATNATNANHADYASMDKDGNAIDTTYAKNADLAAIAKTGNVNDLVQTEGDVLVFNCGTSTEVI